MKNLLLVGLYLLVAASCGGDEPETTNDPTPAPDVVSDAVDAAAPLEDAAPAALSDWPDEVTRLQVIADSEEPMVVTGSLDGAGIIEAGWGDEASVYCWFGPDGLVDFGGPHVFFAIDPLVPKNATLTVQLEPEEGADMNLYVLSFPVGTYFMPPDVPEATSCENGDEAGAGGLEVVETHTISEPYNVLIGVTAPQGTTGGGFSLTVDLTKK